MRGNIYDNYNNKDFDYDYPITFKERNKEYLEMLSKPSVTWRYGDSVKLRFTVSKDATAIKIIQELVNDTHFVVVDLPGEAAVSVLDIPILYIEGEEGEGWITKIEFYDFRFEEIYSYTADGYGSTLEFSISKEDSAKIFKQGVYYFKIFFINDKLNEQFTVSANTETYIFVR